MLGKQAFRGQKVHPQLWFALLVQSKRQVFLQSRHRGDGEGEMVQGSFLISIKRPDQAFCKVEHSLSICMLNAVSTLWHFQVEKVLVMKEGALQMQSVLNNQSDKNKQTKVVILISSSMAPWLFLISGSSPQKVWMRKDRRFNALVSKWYDLHKHFLWIPRWICLQR